MLGNAVKTDSDDGLGLQESLIVDEEPELLSAVKEPALLVVVVIVVVVVLLPVVYFLLLPASQCILVHVVLLFPSLVRLLLVPSCLHVDEWKGVIG